MNDIETKTAIYERMVKYSEKLTDEEKISLQKWENENVGESGKFATSDWPGWLLVVKRLEN